MSLTVALGKAGPETHSSMPLSLLFCPDSLFLSLQRRGACHTCPQLLSGAMVKTCTLQVEQFGDLVWKTKNMGCKIHSEVRNLGLNQCSFLFLVFVLIILSSPDAPSLLQAQERSKEEKTPSKGTLLYPVSTPLLAFSHPSSSPVYVSGRDIRAGAEPHALLWSRT